MQPGVIGLGRMAANIVRRRIGVGHECLVFDTAPKAMADLPYKRIFPRLMIERANPDVPIL